MREILLTSSVLILVILLVRAVLGRLIGMRLRYAMWLLVALRLLIPIQFGQSALSVENMVDRMPQREQTVQTVQVQVDGQAQTLLPAVRQEKVTSEQLVRWIWYVGIGVMAVWHLAVNSYFCYKARKGAKRLRLPDVSLRVFVSSGVASPCLIGTSIFLTPEIASDEEKRAHVLAHELSHFSHGDSLWVIVRAVCLCIYWFDPLVWCAAIFSKQDCELACDEAAIKRLGETERYHYGKTLISVASQTSKIQILHTATTMSQSKRQITERIKTIAKKQKRPLAALLTLCVILAVTTVSTFTSRAEGKTETLPTQASQEPTTNMSTTQQLLPTESTVAVSETETEETTTAETTEEMTSQATAQATPQASITETQPERTQAQLGTITMQVGEQFVTSIYFEQYTSASTKDLAVVRANISHNDEAYYQPQYCRLTITAYSVGTAYIYFSDANGGYLAVVVNVVANGEQEEIGFAEYASQSPSVEIPSFGFP